jgi:energy-coupling factor transporter ATP-binding protein EcfA2
MSNEIKHIQKVEISNLFGRFDFEWTLQPDVNVLAGANGSGKSTVLYCLYNLLTTGTFYRNIGDYASDITITFNNNQVLKYQHRKIEGNVENLETQFKDDEGIKNVLAEHKLVDGSENVRIATYRMTLDDTPIGFTELMKYLMFLGIESINTFDIELKDIESIRKLSNNSIRTELDWEIYNLQKRYLAYQLNLSKKKDIIVENSENPKEDIKKLRQTHNRFLEMLDAMMEETGKKVNREDNEISFLFDDGTPIYPHQLSSGEKQLLIILLTILVQDNKQAILFLDEPEISLHIEWQRKLIGYMRELNPNLQIILATHAPSIIREGWVDKVFDMHNLLKINDKK